MPRRHLRSWSALHAHLGAVALIACTLLLCGTARAQQVAGVKLGQARTYAFLVGCGDYDRRELRPLEFTVGDVQEFHQVLLESGVPSENIVLMHEKQPRRLVPEAKKIREQLDLLLARVDRQSTLIVALSGHGVQFDARGSNYFCPLDARLQQRETLIPLEEIYNQLQACPAERKLLLVDACRNEPQSALAKSRAVVDLQTVFRPQTESVPQGIVALFSCSAGQQSYEHPDLKHGVFFYQLLEGWRGAADLNQDSVVTLDELLTYTKLKTEAFAHAELGTTQIPHLKGDFSGTWILKDPPPPTQSLWKIDAQGNQVNFKEYGPFDGWTPVNCADHNILWRHVDGRISLWVVDDEGRLLSFKEYGPFDGWTVVNCANGRILWRHTDGGISLWKVDANGNQVNWKEYGPFDGWTPVNCSDNNILWRHADGGISLWVMDDEGNQLSYKEYGPFDGWTVVNCANGRVLWRHADGRISLWKVDANGAQVNWKEYGPFDGWTPVNCSDNNVLWRHADGGISLWVLGDEGNQVSYKEHWPSAGWTPVNCANGRILWTALKPTPSGVGPIRAEAARSRK